MGDLELLGHHEEEHHIRIDIFPKKVQDRLHAFDENGDGLITQNELAEVMMELDRDDTKINIYSKVIMGGAFLWILTLTVVAMLIFGIVETTKEMKAKGQVMVNSNGQTLQCANSDFYTSADGVLLQRVVSTNRRLATKAAAIKMDIQKIGFNLTSDSAGKDVENLQSVKLVSPDGVSVVTLNVQATAKKLGGGLQLTTSTGYIGINDTHQTFLTPDSGTAELMISQGFYLFDPEVNSEDYTGPWTFVISYTPAVVVPTASPTPMPTYSNATLEKLTYNLTHSKLNASFNFDSSLLYPNDVSLDLPAPSMQPTMQPIAAPSPVPTREPSPAPTAARRLVENNFAENLLLHENNFAQSSKRLQETYKQHEKILKQAPSESLTLTAAAPTFWNGTMIDGVLTVKGITKKIYCNFIGYQPSN